MRKCRRVPSGRIVRIFDGRVASHAYHPAWVILPLVQVNVTATSTRRGSSAGSDSTSVRDGYGRSPVSTYRSVFPATYLTVGSELRMSRTSTGLGPGATMSPSTHHSSISASAASRSTAWSARAFP